MPAGMNQSYVTTRITNLEKQNKKVRYMSDLNLPIHCFFRVEVVKVVYLYGPMGTAEEMLTHARATGTPTASIRYRSQRPLRAGQGRTTWRNAPPLWPRRIVALTKGTKW